MDHHALMSRKLATLLATAALVAVPAITNAADAPTKRSFATHYTDTHGQKLAKLGRNIEVFVRFDEPSVAEFNVASIETTGELANSQAQKAQAARVTAQQATMRNTLAGYGARILSAQRIGANGLRVSVSPAQIEALRALPGVRSVGRVEYHKLDNINSVPWIGAPAVWAKFGKGEGVKVGIIDSGIDYTHADFGGAGTVAAHDGNNPTVIEPDTFPTTKVKGGFDFAGSVYDASSDVEAETIPHPDPDPIDFGPGGGHGTHVAGTAAGIGVPGSVGPGVAPGADLYAIKVFGDSGGSTNLTSLGIEWAMDPNGDGDMSDHLDVINMSLGAPFGSPEDPSAISSQNAAALGIIVVASAGNEGLSPYVTGAPAVAPDAISVAASRANGTLFAVFTADAPASVAGTYESVEGSGGVTLAATGPITAPLVNAAPLNGCTPFTNAAAVAGKIALIIRGTCSFIVKVQQAKAAGAIGAVVFNDGADPTRVRPIGMALDATATIPALMISSDAGRLLATTPGVTATLKAAQDPDAIVSFSSIGPSLGGSGFKPDLAAPGEDIVSADMGSGTGNLTLSGTSMAAPHVTGAAALLRQLHPKLNQSAIKALLQNSTVDASETSDTRITRSGTGVIRVDRAAALTSYASPGGVAFGRINPLVTAKREQHVKLANLSNKSRTFNVQHVANRTLPGVDVDCPSKVRVGSKGTSRFDIELRFDPRQAARRGVFDDGIVSQTEVDGWCVLKDGTDTLRVAYTAVVDPASAIVALPGRKLQSVNLLNLGPALGIAEGFTLAKRGGEAEEGRTDASIAAVGFRRADPAVFPFDSIEFGIALQKAFEHVSTFEFDLFIDNDGDGGDDVLLVGVDVSAIVATDPGTFVTLQIDLATGDAFLPDWFVSSWDFNDRTLSLPFTLTSGGGFVADKFNYTLNVFAGDGTVDTQHGSVDLSQELVPDINSFVIDSGDNVNVTVSGPTGKMLWLLPNDVPAGQVAISQTVAPKKK